MNKGYSEWAVREDALEYGVSIKLKRKSGKRCLRRRKVVVK